MIPAHLWFLPLCFFIAQGAAGATGTRHSLRPLLIWRDNVDAKLGRRSRRGNAKSYFLRQGEGTCDERSGLSSRHD